ncbi:MAG: chemotaxis protein CheW [Proteobacteria bacterium]|nr:chemotaxis protein CheW [Pseudomonadota bacterium]
MTKNALVAPKNYEDCWKRVGVWGDEKPRCERLKEVIHCRNCEIYTRAGRNLLERPLPEEYSRDWTEVMASCKEEEDLGTLVLVVFRIESEWLALPAEVFDEVIEVGQIHSIPHRNSRILKGIINVHGEIHLCVSLRDLLGLELEPDRETGAEAGLYRRMMIINSEEGRWVFHVDEIHGIQRIPPREMQNVPVTVAKSKNAYSRGLFSWKGRNVALLDEKLLVRNLARSVQ